MKRPIGFFWGSDASAPLMAAVYTEASRGRIKEQVEISDDLLTPAMLEGTDTSEVEYLFSTWGFAPLDEEAIARHFPNLKAVLYAAGSVQGFARPFLSRGARVFSAWGANGVPVAEFTVAQIILANKGYFQAARLYRRERGNAAARQFCGRQQGNFDVKIGVLGAGMIGRLVIEMLAPYQVEILLFDKFLDEQGARALGTRLADLDEIFATCQVITNHIGNNEQTRHMLRYEHFSKMLPNATFINTGRGRQLIEADLIRALREEPERTALLDVTDPEPVPPDSPLLDMDNVFLSPHIAGSQCGERARMGLYMAEELERLLSGRPVRFEVTEEMLATMA